MSSVPKPLSIQRCCALPHSGGDDLSEEEITVVRDRTDAMASLTMICFANGARNPTSATMTSTPSDACGSISIWFQMGGRLESALYEDRRFGRSNRATFAVFNHLWWIGMEIRFGGPDFPQMEPTDQLDAPNRRLPESRVRRFAKRKSASRTSSIFLANPHFQHFANRATWLPLALEALFWRVAGTIVGTVPLRDERLSRHKVGRDQGRASD